MHVFSATSNSGHLWPVYVKQNSTWSSQETVNNYVATKLSCKAPQRSTYEQISMLKVQKLLADGLLLNDQQDLLMDPDDMFVQQHTGNWPVNSSAPLTNCFVVNRYFSAELCTRTSLYRHYWLSSCGFQQTNRFLIICRWHNCNTTASNGENTKLRALFLFYKNLVSFRI